ncbi:MAG: Fur family transcriptional regulator [Ilumatobacteraceae bacterium]
MPRATKPPTAPAGPPALSGSTAAAVLPALALRELRLTANRRAVLAVLEHAERPLTTEEVAAQAAVPVSTVYRNLAELVDAGVAVRVAGAGGGDRHELAEAYSDHHHHHLVCTECGIVTDFTPSRALERLIDKEIGGILGATGFQVEHHVFDVRGRCRACSAD